MAGRPSKYESEIKPKLEFIPALVAYGFNQEQIAKCLGINADTLYEYKKKYPEFSEALDKKDQIAEVEKTFFNRLTGKYKAVREVEELNRETGKLELVKRERYELPLNEGAYKYYLTIMSPKKWKESNDDNSLSNVTFNVNLKDYRKKEDGN